MKAILITLIAIVTVAIADLPERRFGNPNFQMVNVTFGSRFVECRRTWVSGPSDDDPTKPQYSGYRITARAISECDNGHRLLRAAEINLGAGSKPGPHFWARTLYKRFTSDTVLSLGFNAYLAFDRFGVYDEGGVNPGFDPADNDTLIWHVDLFRNLSFANAFTPIHIAKSQIIGGDGTDNDAFYTLSFNSTSGAFPAHPNLVLTFTLDVTPTVTKFGNKVLTPNSFKLTINADGIDYNSLVTPGGAYLGAFLLTYKADKGIIKSNATFDVDAPGQPSVNINNMDLSDNDTDNDRGFFSFDAKAWGAGPNKTVNVVAIRSVSEDIDLPFLDEFIKVTARRIHFSTLTKEASIEWDPSIGSVDAAGPTATSSGVSNLPSFVLLFVALLALLL